MNKYIKDKSEIKCRKLEVRSYCFKKVNSIIFDKTFQLFFNFFLVVKKLIYMFGKQTLLIISQ